ncbi:MAG: hypothetical protein H8D45_18985 [Bacteroidetes bacterium]|nr:hypothetical protein [Bacteroidota bacterium]MBL7105592.1 hypothetical protein [Bacteroidales bacterium]
MVKDNYKKYKQLRNKYIFFTFEGYSISETQDSLEVVYNFNLNDRFHFFPSLKILKKSIIKNQLSFSEIENFIFHIGLIELISYWKAACPPKIIIKPFRLSKEQIAWWKKIYFKGLGEFFYVNNIKCSVDDFVEIIVDSEKEICNAEYKVEGKKVLIPVGGGKDSIVTLELLKERFQTIPFILNPKPASINTIKVAGFKDDELMEIQRTIHPQLLELNDKGFLNGHTPFSALLAFVSILAAALTGSRHIALSNEVSANEPTEKATGVNHQYSKSFEFEKDFREYVSKFITPDINYFSFLRPMNEYGIARLFSRFPEYLPVFKSCNIGSKTDSWCCKCPKCLFVFIILSPFIDKDELIKVFGKDIFQDPDLLKYFDELTGKSIVKPFECVGTIDEVNLAVMESIKKRRHHLPYLLEYYKSLPEYGKYQNFKKKRVTQSFEENHFLNKKFLDILKSAKCTNN